MTKNEKKMLINIMRTQGHLHGAITAMVSAIKDEKIAEGVLKNLQAATNTMDRTVGLMESEWFNEES